MPSPPFTVHLRPSHLSGIALVTLHLFAAAAALLAELGWATRTVLWSGIGLSALTTLRRIPERALRLHPDGRMEVLAGADWQPALPLPGSLAAPLLTVVRYREEGQRRSRAILVLPDSMDGDARRRLRVWLKWRAKLASGDRAEQT